MNPDSNAQPNFQLLTITEFTSDLVADALALDRHCLGGIWSASGYDRELANPGSIKLVLQTGGQPENTPLIGMGFAWSILEEAHITLLAIDPAHQRQGLGQLLLVAILQQARQIGLERATLEVRASNQAAISLYEKFGFRSAGRRRHYYSDPKEDGLILWRSGLQTADFAEILTQHWTDLQHQLTQRGWQLHSQVPQGLASPASLPVSQ